MAEGQRGKGVGYRVLPTSDPGKRGGRLGGGKGQTDLYSFDLQSRTVGAARQEERLFFKT